MFDYVWFLYMYLTDDATKHYMYSILQAADDIQRKQHEKDKKKHEPKRECVKTESKKPTVEHWVADEDDNESVAETIDYLETKEPGNISLLYFVYLVSFVPLTIWQGLQSLFEFAQGRCSNSRGMERIPRVHYTI